MRNKPLPVVDAVAIPRSHVTHVVTEHGVARIRGLSGSELARSLAAVAAPQHRAALAA